MTRKKGSRSKICNEEQKYDNKTSLASGQEGRLERFVEGFKSCFHILNSESDKVCKKYLSGLFVSERSNCSQISENIEQNSQSLNHFISNSPWSWQEVYAMIAQKFTALIPSEWSDDLCLMIDESGFPKKGNKSVGVMRQYCGQSGKVDNCQVGVFASLVCKNLYTLFNGRLYLPKKWCQDENADIPKERRVYKTKIELALEMILHARQILNIPFRWVGMDSYYGRDQKLLAMLNKQQIVFVSDIPQNATLYEKRPSLYIPENKAGARGRKFSKYKIKGKSKQARTIVAGLRDEDYTLVKLRTSIHGNVVEAFFYRKTVYIVEKQNGDVIECSLLIRKDKDGTLHYILTNSDNKDLNRLAYMHGQRYFIERSFQETKQELGLNQYQVRSYAAWHRHMAVCMMGHLFLQTEKKLFLDNDLIAPIPKLVQLIKTCLPRKVKSAIEIVNEILSLNDLTQIKSPT